MGCAQLLPEWPEEEDVFIEVHTNKLKEQAQLDPDGRHAVVQETASVTELQERYPLLFDTVEVQHEFARILGYDLNNPVREGLDRYAQKLLLLKPLEKEQDVVKSLRLDTASSVTEIERLCISTKHN